MKTIYKYPLTNCSGIGKYTVVIPRKARLLCVGSQEGTITIWAEVDTEEVSTTRSFTILGTGWELVDNVIYLGTVFLGAFVWHVYENLNDWR